MLTRPALALGVATLAIGLAACGGSSSTSSSASATSTSSSASAPSTSSSATSSAAAPSAASGQPIAVAASPGGQLTFTKTSLTAKAGKVTIRFTNDAPLGHNLMVQQGTSGPVLGGTPTFQGGTKTLTVTLKPGTYTFFCGVPGHRMAGMQGTLTVS